MPGLVVAGLAGCVSFSRPLCLQSALWRGTNSFFLPQVDTASEVEELEVDSVSLLPASEGNSGGARIQVFLARYRWVPLAQSATPCWDAQGTDVGKDG